MSYTIFYNKQFIKVDENRVIPFMEMGCNNVWEMNNRKRARDWENSRSFTGGEIIIANDELLSNVDKYRTELIAQQTQYAENNPTYTKDPYEDKRFGYFASLAMYGRSTRATTFGAFRNIFVNGINEAKTIEELKEVGVSISIYVSPYSRKGIEAAGLEFKPDVTFTSTEQMIEVIKEYSEYYSNVIGLIGSCFYLRTWNGKSIERLQKKNRVTVKKEKTVKEVSEYWVLECLNVHGYFVKHTKYGYKYVQQAIFAKKFITEAKAKSFLKRMRSSESFVVFKKNENAKFYV